jgi:uncharacterized cupin superfamily protein
LLQSRASIPRSAVGLEPTGLELVPPHVHTREDEYSIMLDGEIGFRSNDREVVLGAGGYIIKPRGEVHAM